MAYECNYERKNLQSMVKFFKAFKKKLYNAQKQDKK